MDVLDPQCAAQKPKICGKLGKFSDREKMIREERKLPKNSLLSTHGFARDFSNIIGSLSPVLALSPLSGI